MKGRLRPWEGTLHPGMELSPGAGGEKLRQGRLLPVPRSAVSAPTLFTRGRMAAPGTAPRPLLEGTVSVQRLYVRGGQSAPLG